jgi:hypothetical protein
MYDSRAEQPGMADAVPASACGVSEMEDAEQSTKRREGMCVRGSRVFPIIQTHACLAWWVGGLLCCCPRLQACNSRGCHERHRHQGVARLQRAACGLRPDDQGSHEAGDKWQARHSGIAPGEM